MLTVKKISKKGFTLVELLIVIAIIAILGSNIGRINFREINNKKQAEVFTSHVAGVFEAVRNSALFGRSVPGGPPDAWRVSVSMNDTGTFATQYLSGGLWLDYMDADFSFVLEKPQSLRGISCDNTGDISAGTGVIEYRGRSLSFGGLCDENDKYMYIQTGYESFTGTVRVNVISGVIETEG